VKLLKEMKGNQKGFSLTEVLIGMAIFGMVGVSVMGALNASSKTIVSAHEITIAESLTRTEIEHIKRSAYDTSVVTTDLAGNINDSTVSIPVDDTSGFPASGIIQIEDELIQYTSIAASTFTGCVRGFNGTTAIDHSDNTPVADTPVYDTDVVDLTADPYYGDYEIVVIGLRLDTEADGTHNDDGIQKITVEIKYRGRSALTTDAYRVNR
jgi:prepilin-type N-terminal cleavage/methylation domain-containing protein